LSGGAITDLGTKTSVDVAAQVPNLTIKQSFAVSVPQIFWRRHQRPERQRKRSHRHLCRRGQLARRWR
jgi:hypothetical protein